MVAAVGGIQDKIDGRNRLGMTPENDPDLARDGEGDDYKRQREQLLNLIKAGKKAKNPWS